MLERLLIQNFQAHTKLRVDFGPGITSIVGPSDVGKSAIIRALRWVATNQPGGDAFVRHGTKGANVRLVVDGSTIVRRRSPGGDVNTYGLDGAEYKAFGRGVPEPIEALLNMGEVCWQGQHDAPYWFSDTAGEVSRQLNSIVNLGIIDETLANVAREFHRARTKLEAAEEALTEAKAEKDALAWVPEFDEELSAVEEAETAATEGAASVAALAALVANGRQHQAAHANATAAAQAGEAMVAAWGQAVQTATRADLLRGLVSAARQLSSRAAVAVPPTDGMEAALATYKDTVRRGTALRDLLKEIQTKEDDLCQRNKELREAEAAMPKVCPTCERSS